MGQGVYMCPALLLFWDSFFYLSVELRGDSRPASVHVRSPPHVRRLNQNEAAKQKQTSHFVTPRLSDPTQPPDTVCHPRHLAAPKCQSPCCIKLIYQWLVWRNTWRDGGKAYPSWCHNWAHEATKGGLNRKGFVRYRLTVPIPKFLFFPTSDFFFFSLFLNFFAIILKK